MPRGVDWDSAEAWYLAEGPGRSFGKVARRFDVSETRVRVVARRDDWRAKAAEIDRNAAAKLRAQAIRTREERVLQNARLHDRSADRLDVRVDAEDLDDAVLLRVYEATGKWVRLDSGEATDRMSFAEVQEALTVVLSIASRYVPRKLLPRFIGEVRDRLALDEGGGESEAA